MRAVVIAALAAAICAAPASAQQAKMSADEKTKIRADVTATVNTYVREIFSGTTREAADVSLKVLNSAIANAVNNDGQVAEELYVSACYADEGITMKRFSPRARGRAGRINKRACHITIIVSRMDDDRLAILQAARSAQSAASRARRVASSRRTSTPAASVEAPVVESVEPETNVEVGVVNEVVGTLGASAGWTSPGMPSSAIPAGMTTSPLP